MYLTPFVRLFREQGEKETRVMTIRGHTELPDDDYALIESYCTDPKYDCRRVMLNVVGRRQGNTFLASISFGFDRSAEMAGPFLDPLNPQSEYADELLSLVTQVLADAAYVARLESHYDQVKRAAADPQDPAYKTIRRIRQEENRWETSPRRTTASARKKERRKK